jgi:hypothetical protein
MKTSKKQTKKTVFINGQKFIKIGNFLTLSGIVKNTFDEFHTYNRNN